MSSSKIGFTEGAGLNIASFAFTEDAVTKHMERIAPGAGVIAGGFSFTTVSAIGLVSGNAACQGKGRIVVCAKAVTGNTDYFTFRLVFKDSSGGVLGVSPLTQISFGELTSGGSPDYRYGTVAAFANDCCASSVELYVVTLPASESVLTAVVAA